VATPATRSTEPADYCAAATTGSPNAAGHGSPQRSPRVTRTTSSPPPGGSPSSSWPATPNTDLAAGRAAVEKTIQAARECPVPEVRRLGRTLHAWRTELLARFDQPAVSNGPTENLNLKVKHTKRIARGYRNFDNYRLRLLLNHGRINENRQIVKQIRNRKPGFVA
jgi:Transposase